MKMVLIVVLLVAGLLSGCVTRTPIVPEVRRFDFPELEEERTAEVGDAVIRTGAVEAWPAMELKNKVHCGDGIIFKRLSVEPGVLVAKEEAPGYTFFYATNVQEYEPLSGTVNRIGGLAVSKTNASRVFIFSGESNNGLAKDPAPVYSVFTDEVPAAGTLQRELIFNGGSASTVKFLYREYSGNLARPPFTQEAQYDLSSGREIGFKGARVEIIDANNTQLRYRVKRKFSD